MAEAKLSPEAQAQLADLTLSLSKNPKTRKQFTRLVKEIDPNARFADVDVDDVREEMEAKFKERELKEKADKERERLERQRHSLIESGRFTEDQVKEIEKDVMEKEGISNYETAAKLYAADRKPATPSNEIKSRTWEMPKYSKDDLGNLAQTARGEAYKVIDEFRKKRA